MTVSTKSTKAELIAALEAAQATLEASQARQATLEAAGTDWPAVRRFIATNAVVTWKEFRALVVDTYNAGVIARQWVSQTVDALSRPVLKSKA
jgi:hypothetical protein